VAAAQPAIPQAQPALQAQAATNLPAQSLKLIPMPRELSAGATQSLAGGVQINCAAPCAAEDSFAIDDLKAYLASQGVAVNTTAPVNILVTRYGSPLANSIYSEAASSGAAAQSGSATPTEMPGEMRPEATQSFPTARASPSLRPAMRASSTRYRRSSSSSLAPARTQSCTPQPFAIGQR